MDALEQAAVVRAYSALDVAISNSRNAGHTARAKAFCDLAYATLRAEKPDNVLRALQKHPNELVQKAVAHSIGDEFWDGPDAAALVASYLASIAEGSLLEQIARYARAIPRLRNGLVASGFSADVIAEGQPKIVRNLVLDLAPVELLKTAAIVVLTKELAAVAQPMFERELRESINRGVNQAVLNSLTDTNNIEIVGTGDALADLREGLKAAAPSNGYVVAAGTAAAIDLATRIENRGGMGVRGGTFVPGVEVVAVDDLTGLRVIPASRIAMLDGGMQVRSSGHASVDMRDNPVGPSQLVSLFQTNSVGLLAERMFHIEAAADADMVVVTDAEG